MDIDFQRIKSRREAFDMRQKDLADLVDVSDKTIFNLEKGESVRLATVKRVCEVLDLPVQEIVTGDDVQLNERGAGYDVDLARRRWELLFARIPAAWREWFMDLIEYHLRATVRDE